ncbi:FAD/NAD(P)-binding protein [Vibrio mexicanus]|uniref:FAD/NAD(P)-binding protein n=1 Tax=Vibrio mexicanus TaxID=1004326 RepID=UPI00063C41CE|nr:FAD/NAD(P)-binding protein [Vibrio mexicanus]
MKSISIVGVGPVGLAMFDALTRECRDTGRRVQINLIDPNPMGHGVYGWEKEDNLLLNTHCGEICCFMDRAAMSTSFDVSHYTFYEWVMKKGLRLNGTALSTTEGRKIKPTDFLPRHLLAQYLHDCFQLINAESTCPVELIPHSVVSLDEPEGQRKCYLKLDDDRVIECDEVIFCLGHGQGAPKSDIRHKVLNCYPAQFLKEHCHPDSRVVISGVGLSAMDAIVSLTQGKGGEFKYDEQGVAIDYMPSGEEPAITMVTSKEMPFLSRPLYDVTAIADYTPHYFTKYNLEKLNRKEVCFEQDVLLLIKREVKLAFGVFLCKLEPSLAFHLETYSENISQFETIMAPYLADCQPDNWFGLSNQQATPEGFYAQLNQDIANSTVPTAYKFAIELLRYLRADLRNFIDSESCSEKCYEDFYASAYKVFYRLNVGPR